MEVVGGAVDQDVQLDADQRHRLVSRSVVHRGVLEVARVDDRDAAGADDGQRLVGSDEPRGVLVEAEADRVGVVGDRRQQAPDAVALPEVLVDDDAVREPESGGERHAVGVRRAAFLAERDHVLAEERGAGARSRDVHAGFVALAQDLRDRRTPERRREPELVAAGQEGSVTGVEPFDPVGAFGVAPLLEGQRPHLADSDLAEVGLVALPGVLELRGRGDDREARGLPATELREALQDRRFPQLLLGAADRDDEATGHAGTERLEVGRAAPIAGRAGMVLESGDLSPCARCRSSGEAWAASHGDLRGDSRTPRPADDMRPRRGR